MALGRLHVIDMTYLSWVVEYLELDQYGLDYIPLQVRSYQ
jgi:hypothetical protein